MAGCLKASMDIIMNVKGNVINSKATGREEKQAQLKYSTYQRPETRCQLCYDITIVISP